MAAYITVGATTTHGGKVISGSPHTTHNGIPISRKGDKVICKKCKKVTTILTGDASFIVDGAPIARAGDVTSCGAKLIAVQQSFCESDFEVMSVGQPAPIQFPKSDPKAVFSSFAAPKDNQPSESYNNDLDILFVSFTPFDNEDNAAEGSLVAGNTYAGEPNEGGGGSDRPIYIPGTAGTPEELRYQAELESIYINVGGDETKFREGVKEIAARDMLAFDILTIPAGLALKSAQVGVKAGQFTIKSRFFPKFPAARILEKPRKIWGRSAEDIAKDFKDAGYTVFEKGSKRPNNQSEIIKIQGHKKITQIQVSPSSARHGGKYYKISTSDRGVVKVVDKKTYKPAPSEKATIIYK